MMNHRVDVKRLVTSSTDGAGSYGYVTVEENIRGFVDLNPGNGAQPWIPEAGRPDDRAGSFFTSSDHDIRPGDRLVVTEGPLGSFEVRGALFPVPTPWGRSRVHHLEVKIVEVARPIATAQTDAPPPFAPQPNEEQTSPDDFPGIPVDGAP
jgi:hypothetical protein